ncbi:Histone deacetylase hda1 [Rhizina undulata]
MAINISDSAITKSPSAVADDPSYSFSNSNINPANSLPSPSLKTGLCFDYRMTFHQTLPDDDDHLEDPGRIITICNALLAEGLVEESEDYRLDTSSGLMTRIGAREARKEEVLLVHKEEHWKFLESTEEALEEINAKVDRDSVYYNQSTFISAKISCGGAIEACRAAVTAAVKNSIAVIRPPGHHAEPCKAMGFSMFNNVSVAARVMQAEYPEECRRILILGNGTQVAFYNDPSVLYISIHRYGEEFYPGGDAGDYKMCGEVGGLGMNVNVPWPWGGMGDGDYIYAFQRVVMPIASEFNPDLVIISAGFDAAAGDFLGGCYVTPAGYAHMTYLLMTLAEGKVVVCLEGGYNLQSISNSAVAVTKVLMGGLPGTLHDEFAREIAVEVVNKCGVAQSQFWNCLKR